MIPVRNPRTGENDYAIDRATPEAIAAAAARLREGQRDWEHAGVDGRVAALRAWRDRLAAARDAIVEALVADTGRLVESRMEVDAILGSIERWCAAAPALLAEEPPRPASIPIVSVAQGMRPYPLVGAISPWNFPLLLSLIDAIPALAAGCAVIVKPSEIAPRFVEGVAPTIGDVPLAYVTGDAPSGEALVDAVDAICFTGSVATGRRVAAQAAARFIPAFLELGGKDPAIVLESADLERATSALVWGSTANAGQSCQSIERIYVAEAIAEPFVELLVAKARDVPLALPTADVPGLGPIIAERQIGVIAAHLDDASAKGAKVRCGGEPERHGGTWFPATVLTEVDHTMRVMREETFGPIMPVMRFGTVDEAVALANDTEYGLSGAVFGDPDEALPVARRVDAGGISVNDAALTALVHDGEKNSFRLSGLGGSRMGPAALRRFGRRQAYLIASDAAPDPWWYPHLQ